MAAPRKVDYERIEPDWRAGIKSATQLAAEYTEATGVAVSSTAINKHFKKLGVPRDLTAKVHAKADAMVLEAMVSGKVSAETTKTTAEIINRVALEVAQVRLAHRVDSVRARTLGLTLLTELETQCADPQALADLGQLMRKPDEKGLDRLNDLYRKIIDTPSRIDSAKKCVETIKTAITMEREAYGLDTTPDAPPSTVKRLEVHLVG